jgi:hypothetical protein
MAKFGFLDHQWRSAIGEAKRVLADRARSKSTISYSELVSKIYSVHLEPHDTRLNHLLGEVSTEEHEAGRGMLTVLVVYKDGDQTPGPGFFELAEELGHDVSDREAFWMSELNKVYAAWSAG